MEKISLPPALHQQKKQLKLMDAEEVLCKEVKRIRSEREVIRSVPQLDTVKKKRKQTVKKKNLCHLMLNGYKIKTTPFIIIIF